MGTWKIGDVVKLKSGGPVMTVREVEARSVQCVWFVEGKPTYANFPGETLERFDREQ